MPAGGGSLCDAIADPPSPATKRDVTALARRSSDRRTQPASRWQIARRPADLIACPCGVPEVGLSCELQQCAEGQPWDMMTSRVCPSALPDLHPALRLAGPARPVNGVQGHRAACAAARGHSAAPHRSPAPAGLGRPRSPRRADPSPAPKPADAPAGHPSTVLRWHPPCSPPAPAGPTTPPPTHPSSGSSGGQSSAASSTNMSELRKSPGQDGGRVLASSAATNTPRSHEVAGFSAPSD